MGSQKSGVKGVEELMEVLEALAAVVDDGERGAGKGMDGVLSLLPMASSGGSTSSERM